MSVSSGRLVNMSTLSPLRVLVDLRARSATWAQHTDDAAVLSSVRVPMEFPALPQLSGLSWEDQQVLLAPRLLTDALAQAVLLLYGRTVINVAVDDQWSCNVVVLPMGGDDCHVWMCDTGDQKGWDQSLTVHHAISDDEATEAINTRRRYLSRALRELADSANNVSAALSTRTLPPAADRPLGALWGIFLDLWWEARVADGCTPEAARMLLGLTVPTAMLRRLVFSESGPPVLTGP